MAKDSTKPVNQNDLVKIIESQLKASSQVLEVVVKTMYKKDAYISAKTANDVKKFQETLNVVFGDDGIMASILTSAESIAKAEKIKRSQIKLVKKIINDIINLGYFIIKQARRRTALINFSGNPIKPIVDVIKSVNESIDELKKISVKKLLVLKWKIKIFKKTIGNIIDFGNWLDSSGLKSIDADVLVKNINAIEEISEGLRSIMKIIRKIHTHSVDKKLAKIYPILNKLEHLLNRINRMKNTRRARHKIKNLLKTMIMLGKLMWVILLLVPIMALFVMFSPIIILCFMAFGFVMKIIIKVIAKFLSAKLFVALALLGLVFLAFTIIAVLLLILIFIVTPIVKGLKNLLIFFLGFLAIVGIIALMGYIMGLALPALFVAAIGILAVTVVIGLILLTAVFLRMLQEIKLDKERILENVGVIMDTAWSIIESIFDRDDPDSNPATKSWYSPVLNFFKGIAGIIEAILAVAFLAATFVSIMLILFMAGALRLLQEVKLDPGQIQENVRMVIETAWLVIDSIWDGVDDKNNDSNRGIFGAVIEFVGGTKLLMIWDAIMAVAFLALSLISVTLILFMAGELRLLQEINLDGEKISNNVSLVIKTSWDVINKLWDPEDDKDNKSGRGLFGAVLSFLGLGQLAAIWDAILTIAFLALTLISINLINFIALSLMGLQKIELDDIKIKNNLDLVIQTAGTVNNALWDAQDDKDNKSEKGFFESILSFFSSGLVEIWNAIQNIAYLALTLSSIEIIKGIAKNLNEIGNITISDNIDTKLKSIINTSNKVIDAVNQPDDTMNQSSSGWADLLSFFVVGMSAKQYNAMATAGYLTEVSTCIEALRYMSNNLMEISKFQEPKGLSEKIDSIMTYANTVTTKVVGMFIGDNAKYKDIDPDDIENVANIIKNYSSIIGSLMTMGTNMKKMNELDIPLMNAIENRIGGIEIDSGQGLRNKLASIVNFMDEIVHECYALTNTKYKNNDKADIIGNGSKIIQGITSIISKDFAKLTTQMTSLESWKDNTSALDGAKNILSSAQSVIEQITLFSGTALVDNEKKSRRIQNIMKNVVDIFPKKDNISLASRLNFIQKSTEQYMKFMDKVNSMDLQKLQSAERLFEHMADFSQSINGNFQDLAEALNDRIAPLLEELKELLSKIPKKMEDIAVGDVTPEKPGKDADTTDENISDMPINYLQNKASTIISNGVGNSAAERMARIKAFNKNRTNAISEDFMGISEILDVLTGVGVHANGVKVRMG